MNLQEGWMKCQVSDGMLPQEYAVECSSADGNVFSFFSPSEYLDIENNLLKVHIIEHKDNHCLVYVPLAPLEGLSRTIKIRAEDLLEI